jgi:photosystem II stability/assembly factor-like uncharacterized protein
MIRKTIDGGQTWVQQTNGQYKQLSGVHFPAPDTGWAVGNQGFILRTLNGGTNWIPQTSGTTQLLRSVYFITTTTGVAVGGGGTIKRTTDGGQTWISIPSGTANTLFSVTFIDDLNGCIVGDNGFILRTVNGGQSWSQQPGVNSTTLLFVNFTSGNAGYAVGFNGTLIKTTLTTGSPEITDQMLHIYPNPVKGNLYLKFPSSARETVGINIYNSIGNRIQSIKLNSLFSEPIDVANLTPGVYFIEINSKGFNIKEKFVVN